MMCRVDKLHALDQMESAGDVALMTILAGWSCNRLDLIYRMRYRYSSIYRLANAEEASHFLADDKTTHKLGCHQHTREDKLMLQYYRKSKVT